MTILALSVTDRIEQYGAYAGFAAVLGLAVLSLLLFAQAREVKRLREWAGRAPERAAEMEARIISDAQERVVATPPAPAPGAARPIAATATPAAQAAKPGGPAGPAAPATAAAAAATAGSAAAAGATGPATGPAAPGAPGPDGQTAAAAPKAPDAPAAGDGASGPPASPAVPAAAPPGTPAAPAPAAGAVPPVPARTAATSATAPSRSVPAGRPGAAAPRPTRRAESRAPARQTVAIVGAAAVLVAALVFVGVQVLGGDDKPKQPNAIGQGTSQVPPSSDTTPGGQVAGKVNRGDVSIAVLNGTSFVGLARSVAEKLAASGFNKDPTAVTNASDQTRSATIVEYGPGHKEEALEVARVIKVGRDAVQPMTEATRVIAGQDAEVVVTVGADQTPQQ